MLDKGSPIYRLLALFVVLAMLAFAAVACGGGEEEEEAGTTPAASPGAATPGATAEAGAPKMGGILHTSYYKDPLYLDIHQNSDMTGVLPFLQATVNYLFRFGHDNVIENDLVESWEQPDATTYILHLVKGVKWQNLPPVNGREFTSADVKWNIERFSAPQPQFSYAENFKGVFKSIETPDNYTVKLTLNQPNAFLMPYLAYPALVMFAKEQVEAAPDQKLTDMVIGTGPFMFESYSRAVGAKYKKNPDYFKKDEAGNQLPYLDGYEVAILTDVTARATAFSTKQIDMGGAGSSAETKRFKELAPDATYELVHIGHQGAIVMNEKQKPFDDVRVRQAVKYASDQQGYIQAVQDGLADVAVGPIPQVFKDWALPASEAYKPDLEKAKALLAEAGYPNGFKVKCLATDFVPTYMDEDVVMKDQLAKVGIEVELDTKNWGEWVMLSYGKRYQMFAYVDQIFPVMDLWLYRRFHTGASGNWTSYSNPQADQLMEQIRVTLDDTERKTLMDEVQRIIVEDTPHVFLWEMQSWSNRWPYVKNYDSAIYALGGYGYYQFETVWLDK